MADFSKDRIVNMTQGNAGIAERLLLKDGATQTFDQSRAPCAHSCSFYMQIVCLHSLKGTAVKNSLFHFKGEM